MVFEWEIPVQIIVEYLPCWQCPNFRAWRAGTRFFEARSRYITRILPRVDKRKFIFLHARQREAIRNASGIKYLRFFIETPSTHGLKAVRYRIPRACGL
jgi:hypothetical protein